MNPFLAKLFGGAATRIRGTEYRIDEKIPLSAILTYLLRRVCWLLRGTALLLLFQQRFRPMFMASRVELRNTRLISFGRFVCLESGVFVDGLAANGIELGDYVTIGRHTIIKATGVLSRLGVGVSIGDRSSMDAFCFVGAAGGVTIGRDVIIGQHASFHAEEHNIARVDIPIKSQGTSRQGITIGDGCWIGANVTFLDGAQVGPRLRYRSRRGCARAHSGLCNCRRGACKGYKDENCFRLRSEPCSKR